MALESGRATMNAPRIRVRSFSGNQYVTWRIMPGKNPASATPKKNLRA
jgi:hypothetical protein